MANEKNLKPFNKRTESEQRKIAKNGGKRSGQVRKEKKIFKETIEKCLKLKTPDEITKTLRGIFPELPEKVNLSTAMILCLVNNVLKRDKNSVQSFLALRDTIGEKPVDVIDNKNPQVVVQNDFSVSKLKNLKKILDE